MRFGARFSPKNVVFFVHTYLSTITTVFRLVVYPPSRTGGHYIRTRFCGFLNKKTQKGVQEPEKKGGVCDQGNYGMLFQQLLCLRWQHYATCLCHYDIRLRAGMQAYELLSLTNLCIFLRRFLIKNIFSLPDT